MNNKGINNLHQATNRAINNFKIKILINKGIINNSLDSQSSLTIHNKAKDLVPNNQINKVMIQMKMKIRINHLKLKIKIDFRSHQCQNSKHCL